MIVKKENCINQIDNLISHIRIPNTETSFDLEIFLNMMYGHIKNAAINGGLSDIKYAVHSIKNFDNSFLLPFLQNLKDEISGFSGDISIKEFEEI
ncbi:MAG: hypothetical protein SFU21_04190, partial [Flavihumibacter sp.]|nr:hypothetical protein [Flavihumibacter sp.]